MPAPSPLPEYVWKIVPSHPGDLTNGLLVSELDRKDGFIHLSTAEQVPKTVGRFFSSTNTVYILQIPLAKIESKVKWEEAGHGCFPHIYDGDLSQSLGNDNIENIVKCERGDGEAWEPIVEKQLHEAVARSA